jgi:hypothetical protein
VTATRYEGSMPCGSGVGVKPRLGHLRYSPVLLDNWIDVSRWYKCNPDS